MQKNNIKVKNNKNLDNKNLENKSLLNNTKIEKNKSSSKNLNSHVFNKTVGFVSLGCDKNRVDTEKIITTLSKHSCFEFVGNKSKANVIIINTCSFLKMAREESKKVINEMGKLKDVGKLEKLIIAPISNFKIGKT